MCIGSRGRAAAALAFALALGSVGGAQAITINHGAVNCFDCTVASNGTPRLTAGERFSVSNTGFLDGRGDPFDVLFEVLAVGAAPGLSDPQVGAFNLVGLNRFVHYRVTTIEAGSASAEAPDGRRITVQGLDTISILDVDSNEGQDFSDVAGATLPIAWMGEALEEGGFEGLPGAPTAGFSYARLARDGSGSAGDWRDEDNRANDPMHTVSFLAGGGLSQFEFIWGATSPGDDGGRTRGWEMEFSASSTVVPLPAGALLAISGLALMGMVRAARRGKA
ncbi:MAG: hypothetical protein AAF676_08340 [Pseudomonadota bacterium]